MNYQHQYHAGSAADVFKHVVLCLILETLTHKEKPFCYIESHAGSGCYDLTTKAANATKEYQQGITLLWGEKDLPQALQNYLTFIEKINTDKGSNNRLHYYPGSPLFAEKYLRINDRMVLAELNPEAFSLLQKLFRENRQIKCHKQEGYALLKSILPPKERRGLVFIDPAFEQANEFPTLVNHLSQIYQRWPTGIYMVWYPLKDKISVQRFYSDLKKTSLEKILVCEFCPWANDVGQYLYGSGLIIINPPWQLEEKLNDLLPTLLEHLKQDRLAQTQTFWLKEEG